MAAFYSRELSQSFTDMEDVPGMQSYLVDSAHSIVYAESGEILGRNAEDVWNDLPDGYSNYWIIDDKEVVVVGTCRNDWQVICVAPENVLFAEQLRITRFAIVVYIIMLVVAVLAAGILYSQVAVKDGVLSQIRQKADYDQLTNVLNKQSFRDLIDTKLGHAGEGTKHICMMLDMDNFKMVNDTYGHQEGDKFLKKSVAIFRETLGTQAIIGRMGGDEFAVYIPYEYEEETVIREEVARRLDALLAAFHKQFDTQYESCKVSLSAGICLIIAGDGIKLGFEGAYQMADRALYVSKENGKHQYNWYED